VAVVALRVGVATVTSCEESRAASIAVASVGGQAAAAPAPGQASAAARPMRIVRRATLANDMGRQLACAAVLALVATQAATSAPPERFQSSVSRVTARDLPFSYRPGCPVAPAQLRLVRVSHWGFDGQPRNGVVVVHEDVARDVVAVFARLYAQRFPIRRLKPIDAYRGSDELSLAADNTAGFNCRYAIAAGPKRWSAHAYGKAIDVNPRENPYLLEGNVLPPAGRAYLDRSKRRPGMAVRGGTLVEAFSEAGWQWGGRWSGSPDYQHFSASGG
jgi:hypothetical protein